MAANMAWQAPPPHPLEKEKRKKKRREPHLLGRRLREGQERRKEGRRHLHTMSPSHREKLYMRERERERKEGRREASMKRREREAGRLPQPLRQKGGEERAGLVAGREASSLPCLPSLLFYTLNM